MFDINEEVYLLQNALKSAKSDVSKKDKLLSKEFSKFAYVAMQLAKITIGSDMTKHIFQHDLENSTIHMQLDSLWQGKQRPWRIRVFDKRLFIQPKQILHLSFAINNSDDLKIEQLVANNYDVSFQHTYETLFESMQNELKRRYEEKIVSMTVDAFVQLPSFADVF
jgi:hypothetical protein